MPDHVHVLVSFPATIAVADLVKQVKGTTSHVVNEKLQPETQFKWQGSYGAFTVSHSDVERVINYIERQKEHHKLNDLWPEWEETLEL
jgi:REP element-mobilizing transposase RayT